MLNQPAPTSLFDFDEEEAGIVLDVTLEDFNITETYKALKNLKNNRAAGLDEVTAEPLKHGRDTVARKLTDLFNRIWRAEEVPDDWKQ